MDKTVLEIFELLSLASIDCCTLVGNSMIILAFILGPRTIRTFTNYFVVNLAVADLMVGCFSLPFWIFDRLDSTLVNKVAYKYFIAIDILCGTISILNLTAISLERMYAVKFPTKHYNLSSNPVLMVIAGTWSLAIPITGSTFAVSRESKKGMQIYTASIFILVFVIPLSVISCSYSIIFDSARRMMTCSSNGNLKRELRIAKTISVIIGLFVFCWMPFFIVNMLYVFCNETLCEKLPNWLVNVTKIMHYSNSMMNFFVYAQRSPDFRRSFQAFFKLDLSPLQVRIRTFSESLSARSRSASVKSKSHSRDHLNNRLSRTSATNLQQAESVTLISFLESNSPTA